MTAARIVLAIVVIAVIGAFLMLLFLRGTDAQTRLLCRDAARRLGRGFRFLAGEGLKPNRIAADAPGYALVAELSPGRRVGWRLDVELKPRGAGYPEPLPREAAALLARGRRDLLGDTTVERGAIRHAYHQGALLDAERLADTIRFVVELHERLRPPDGSLSTERSDG